MDDYSSIEAGALEKPFIARGDMSAADANGADLPECKYRFAIGEKDRYFCRHSNVHTTNQLVDSSVCRACSQRTRECLLPRPVPTLPYSPANRERTQGPWEYVSLERMVADVRELVGMLPCDLAAVAGIPRSGLLPATQIATILHLPLCSLCRERGLVEVGQGLRLETTELRDGQLLVVDDSVYGGVALWGARDALRRRHPGIRPLFAALYPRPEAIGSLDYFIRTVGDPHLFEWNLYNCNQTQSFGFDFDGVLCHDWPGGDENGDAYQEFLSTARPRWLPRRRAVPLIVTARLEKHRAATIEWLRRHGVRFEQLVMGPWSCAAERRRHYDAGRFKGQAYADSPCTLFIESDERQAEAIFQRANRPVLCPTTGRIFQ
jgi:uncharacterized HAD superfamily protein